METLIKFETAKLAKSKGFFEGFLLYNENGEIWYTHFIGEDERKLFSAVSQSVLRKWLRDEHGIDIEVRPSRIIRTDKAKGYTANILTPREEKWNWDLGGVHPTYEEALELSLTEAIKLI